MSNLKLYQQRELAKTERRNSYTALAAQQAIDQASYLYGYSEYKSQTALKGASQIVKSYWGDDVPYEAEYFHRELTQDYLETMHRIPGAAAERMLQEIDHDPPEPPYEVTLESLVVTIVRFLLQ